MTDASDLMAPPPSGGVVVSTPQVERLKRRADFLLAAKARSAPRGAVVMQGRARGDGDAAVRIGFTATRKIGGAVVRNRAKRRLREAARLLAPAHVLPGCDYVLIARGGTATRPWPRLLDDVKSALITLRPLLAADAGGPTEARDAVSSARSAAPSAAPLPFPRSPGA